jgi:hypothetical protein
MVTTRFHGRAKYFLTFIDDFFRRTFLYTMKIKFGVLDKLNVFKDLVKIETKKKIEVIRCNGGEEYNSKNFNTFYKDNGIMK